MSVVGNRDKDLKKRHIVEKGDEKGKMPTELHVYLLKITVIYQILKVSRNIGSNFKVTLLNYCLSFQESSL